MQTEASISQPVVLHVITDSFSASTIVAPLAQHLNESGWRNVIACSGRSYDDAHSFIDQMRDQGLDVRDVHIPRNISPITDVMRVVELCGLIRRERPSLVHSHLAKGGIVGRIAARLVGVPCVHTVYDFAFVEHSGLRRWGYRVMERAAAPMAERIMFISENERQMSLAGRIGEPEQLVTVGCGVDLSLFNPHNVSRVQVADVKQSFGVPAQRLVVGAVARLVPRKGIDLLLKAVSMLPTKLLDWHLLVVGGGPLQRSLATMATELRITDRVSFTGFIDDPRLLPAIVGAMDIFCLPSRREGFGMVYAEAGAMGKPVVAPDMSPVNTIVRDGITGILSRPEDPTAIAAAVQRLLQDEKLRIEMGKEAQAFTTENCDIRAALQRTAIVYEEVLRPVWSARGRTPQDQLVLR